MNRRRATEALLQALLAGSLGFATPGLAELSEEERQRLATEELPDFRVPRDEALRAESNKLARMARIEHPLARTERLAHAYAYGVNGSFKNKALLYRMKADGFEVMETFQAKDGTAAMVVKDERTQRYTVVFRGTDDANDAFTDILEAARSVVGISQFSAHRQVWARWAAKYGKEGKLDVTGHSLGGGLAQLFALKYADLVQRMVAFQAPAQGEELARHHQVDDGPERILVQAGGDPVGFTGHQHQGIDRVYVAQARNMGLAKGYGHTEFLLQNEQMENVLGDKVREADDKLSVAEIPPQTYQKLRALDAIKPGDPVFSNPLRAPEKLNVMGRELIKIVQAKGESPNHVSFVRERTQPRGKPKQEAKMAPAPQAKAPEPAAFRVGLSVNTPGLAPGEVTAVVVEFVGGTPPYEVSGATKGAMGGPVDTFVFKAPMEVGPATVQLVARDAEGRTASAKAAVKVLAPVQGTLRGHITIFGTPLPIEMTVRGSRVSASGKVALQGVTYVCQAEGVYDPDEGSVAGGMHGTIVFVPKNPEAAPTRTSFTGEFRGVQRQTGFDGTYHSTDEKNETGSGRWSVRGGTIGVRK